jgi:hypothetical protein
MAGEEHTRVKKLEQKLFGEAGMMKVNAIQQRNQNEFRVSNQ